jgi:hypothetical protein
MIIVLQLLVRPTMSRLGIRCIGGCASSASNLARIALARV